VKIASLAVRTEVMFAAMDGEVIPRERYVVVRTPSNPTFYWGNFLVLRDTPTVDGIADWLACFERELPGAGHRLFVTDDPHAETFDVTPFQTLGFIPDETSLLRFSGASPVSSEWGCAPLRSHMWEEALALLDRSMTPKNALEDRYRAFLRIQMGRYRRLVERGLGQWFGVVAEDRLVGTCGIFEHEGLCRFQTVAVDEAWRRKGIATSMVSAVARYASERWPNEPILIGAGSDSDAERIYMRAGFERAERIVGLLRRA
jgi:GNAT superfamily N-acetyltransferase